MNLNSKVMKRKLIIASTLFVALGLLGILLSASAAGAVTEQKINKTLLLGLAIDGYDTVAYFTLGKALQGDKKHTYEWGGAKWRFASKENLDLFKADPEKYVPQYGGYCAYAMASANYANIDPAKWTIYDGKLYLNYDKKSQDEFRGKIKDLVEKANQNWEKLKK